MLKRKLIMAECLFDIVEPEFTLGMFGNGMSFGKVSLSDYCGK